MAMKRVDVMMEEDMINGADKLARRRGITRSGLIKSLLARDLTSEFGLSWRDEADKVDQDT